MITKQGGQNVSEFLIGKNIWACKVSQDIIHIIDFAFTDQTRLPIALIIINYAIMNDSTC